MSHVATPRERPRRREEVRKRRRSQKTETATEPPKGDGMAAAQQPSEETEAHSGLRESSDQRDAAPRQPSKERCLQKHRGAPKDKSSATPQDQGSAEEQGSWTGRLSTPPPRPPLAQEPRGSQSTKV